MTEVPDHLLQRSRERRAALGGESAPPAAPSGGGEEAAEPSASAPVPAAAAAAPAVVEEAAPPAPLPPYVQAALTRKKLPVWMAPAGVAALLWIFLYAGVLFSPGTAITDPVLEEGQQIYAAQCAGCHGASGGGGTGRVLAGEVFLTFPNIEDHLAWVRDGSPAPGTPYGDPNRPGGQHRSQDGFGAMPAFGSVLSEEEILAVVRYEREVLDSAPPPEESGGASGAASDEGADEPTDPSSEAETEGGDVGGNDPQTAGEADSEPSPGDEDAPE